MSKDGDQFGPIAVDRPLIELFVKAAVDKMKVGGCPFCHRYFLALYLLRDRGVIDLIVTTYMPENPPKEVLAFSSGRQYPLVRVQKFPESSQKDLKIFECETVDEIEMFLEQFSCTDMLSRKNSKSEDAAETIFEDLYMKFLMFLKTISSDATGLIKSLEKIDAYLKDQETAYLLSNQLARADCYLIPVLQHLRVAGKAYKNFEIPTELFYLWRYLKNVYETQAMNDTCPADREIIAYYQLKASCPPHLSKAQSLLGDERTFSYPERSLYLNGEFEDLL